MSFATDVAARLGLSGRRWASSRISQRWLIVAAALSVACWQAAEHGLQHEPQRQRDALLAAARAALAAQQEVARVKKQLGLMQSVVADPNRTGLIGPDWSEIATTIGDLPAKRTVTNPDFAAMLARALLSFDLPSGAAVGLVLSGSFVGASVAAITAVEALGLKPVVVSSLGASMYGATDPSLTWIDMEAMVRRAGVWQARSVAVVLGGEGAAAAGMDAAGRDLLIAAARRNGYEPIAEADLTEIKPRVHAAFAAAAPAGVLALINSGGAVLGIGTCLDAYRLPSGVLRERITCHSGVPGLVHEFAGRGVPVINILNIKRLALDWGLPFDPVPLPTIGENARVYRRLAFPW